MLYNSSPDPSAAEKSHDEYVRVARALVQSKALPVEEAAKEEICSDLA